MARLITGTPCFTVKANNPGYADRLVCGTQNGTLMIADIANGFLQRSMIVYDGLDEDERQRVDNMHATYFMNFPQRNPEKEKPVILMPIGEYPVHRNSIFDLIWLKGSCSVLTGSGDKESIAFDL